MKTSLYSKATPEQIKRHRAVVDSFDIAMSAIEDLIPNSREKSLAITNLEQSLMWAGKAIYNNE